MTKCECLECGKIFKKRIGKNTVEIECPNCGSIDIELFVY